MLRTSINWLKPATQQISTIALALAVGSFSLTASAQSDQIIRDKYPQLADLFNAFDVTQASAFEKIQQINSDPSTQRARNELAMQLQMAANSSMSESMTHGHSGMDMNMNMSNDGPYQEIEVAARIELLELMRASHSDEVAKRHSMRVRQSTDTQPKSLKEDVTSKPTCFLSTSMTQLVTKKQPWPTP